MDEGDLRRVERISIPSCYVRLAGDEGKSGIHVVAEGEVRQVLVLLHSS